MKNFLIKDKSLYLDKIPLTESVNLIYIIYSIIYINILERKSIIKRNQFQNNYYISKF